MSLTAVYFQCNDGMYYADPTWRTADAFVCTDDKDPPELVVKKPPHCTPEQAFQLALQQLTLLDITAAQIQRSSYYGGSLRWFPKDDLLHVRQRDFKPAFRFYLRFTATPPPPTMHRGVFDRLEDVE